MEKMRRIWKMKSSAFVGYVISYSNDDTVAAERRKKDRMRAIGPKSIAQSTIIKIKILKPRMKQFKRMYPVYPCRPAAVCRSDLAKATVAQGSLFGKKR
jgi:hypothetical protein